MALRSAVTCLAIKARVAPPALHGTRRDGRRLPMMMPMESRASAARVTQTSRISIGVTGLSIRHKQRARNQCSRPLGVCASAASAASMHTLPDGKRLEVISMKGREKGQQARPPLVFIHGSYHSAWCWEENFLPFFSEIGYDCHAVSLRAQGGSDRVEGPYAAETIDVHANDIASFIGTLDKPPVVVAHSFGGAAMQWYIGSPEDSPTYPPLAGIVYMASVPPTGNKDIVSRFLLKTPILAIKLSWWFIKKRFGESEEAARVSFFSDDLPQEDLLRYMDQFKNSSSVGIISISEFNKTLPLPFPPADAPPTLVMGGVDDKVVDQEAVDELSEACSTKPVVLQGLAHDMMLDTRWQQAADVLKGWLEKL